VSGVYTPPAAPADAPLGPAARVRRLTDNVVVATTTAILSGGPGWALDKAGTLRVELFAGDPGDGSGGAASSMGAALLAAVGSDDGLTAPVPSLLEFSLDGVAGPADSVMLIEKVARDMKAGQPTMRVDGDDLWTLYATLGVDRATYTQVRLQDALSGAAGTIVPLSGTSATNLISANGSIPYLAGVMTTTPGSPTWNAAARARITYTALCDPAVAGLATNLDVWADLVAKVVETIAHRLGGVIIAGDDALGVAVGYRGHLVADCSSYPLNLADSIGAR